ncbi:MAG: Dabb family protein [Chthoniobacteraceae bacterium]
MKLLLCLLMLATSSFAGGPVRHIVHFKFRADATQEQVQRVISEFEGLQKKIKVIDGFEWGTNVSPEGLDKGFRHCWILTFRSEADRDTYLHHADHVAFAALVKPLLADVHVVDFIPAKPTFVPAEKVKKPMRTGIPKAWGAQKTG